MAQPKAETPDEVLVVAAILGDFEAFDVLVRRYRAAVVRTAQSIVAADDAEDVAQDALLLAFKALPSIDDPAKFAAWLMVITRHRALRLAKQAGKRQRNQMPLDTVLLEQVGALTEPLVHQQETSDALRQAFDTLPDDYALALRLHFLDEVPQKRIAAFLDVPLSTVKWRVFRGKQLLREAFEKTETLDTIWTEI